MANKARLTLSSIAFFLLASCGKSPFTNWGFESGSFAGWTKGGDADTFTLSTEEEYEEGTRYFLQEGNYHLLGSEEKTGTLRSPNFKIGGSGYISFLLSEAPERDKTYVAIVSAKTKKVLEKVYNEYYLAPFQTSTYVRFNLDLSQYLKQEVYLELVDESSVARLNFDDLITLISEEELIALNDDANVRLGIARHSDGRRAADIYTKLNKWKVKDENRFNYHLTSQIGWMNDPNGFSYYHDKVHLFYQHNPYSTTWGPMHWGHATTSDFVKWEHEPTALAPDQNYDVVGAFSGSTLEFNNQIYTLYTGASHEGQVQALAVSSDGVTFQKYSANPVISEKHLPANASIVDFRDPKMFKRGNEIYAIISARNTNNNYSSLLLYKTRDLYNWQYAGRTFSNGPLYADTLGVMLECPDLINVDGQDMILVSPQTTTNHRNSDSNVYITGEMNWQTGVLEKVDYAAISEIDHGFDFYAPTTLTLPDDRVIMVAWMAGWNRTPVTSQFGYAGAQTFPRTLNYQAGKLIQWPVTEITNYYQNEYSALTTFNGNATYINELGGRSKDLSFAFKPNEGRTTFDLFDDKKDTFLSLYYENGYTYLDRSLINNGYFPAAQLHNVTRVKTPLINGEVKIRVLLDKYSAEVFVADGQGAMSATMMTSNENEHLKITATNPTLIKVSGYDIVV